MCFGAVQFKLANAFAKAHYKAKVLDNLRSTLYQNFNLQYTEFLEIMNSVSLKVLKYRNSSHFLQQESAKMFQRREKLAKQSFHF